jgi:toxin FitB
MIVLDTNVLSEVMKPSPDRAVAAWMAGENPNGLFTTAVTEAEIRLGIEVLPTGRRKQELEAAAQRVIALFDNRILPFDTVATQEFARIVAGRSANRRLGRPDRCHCALA